MADEFSSDPAIPTKPSAGQGASGFVKARIEVLDPPGKSKSPPTYIEVMFNPQQLSFARRGTWSDASSPEPGSASVFEAAKNAVAKKSNLEFKSAGLQGFTIKLFFDTYSSPDQKDVREYTSGLWKLLEPEKPTEGVKKTQPPLVQFQWGPIVSPVSVVEGVDQEFLLFLSNGTPVRANVTVRFKQFNPSTALPPTNPTSGGVGGEQIHRVVRGDTLAMIAHAAYGDASRWRLIADANRLTRVRDLEPGLELLIPPLSGGRA